MKRLLHLLSLLIALTCSAQASAQVDTTRLQYIMDDSPPFTFTYLGRPTGLGTDILKLVWQEMNLPPQPIRIMPWSRGLKYAEVMPDICLFLAEWTPDRARRFKFAKPVYTSTVSVLVDTEQAGSVGCLEALRSLHISLPRMENVEMELLNRGAPPDHLDRSTTTGTAVRMLVRARAQAIAGEESSIRQHLAHYGLSEDRFERVCVFNRREMGFLFSRQVPDEFVERFQKALDSILATPEYQDLLEKYLP